MISARLKAAAEYLKGFDYLADCGTDHGYLPIYAVENRFVKKAIASDNKQSPLKNAEDNIIYLGLVEQIELKLADGLDYLQPDIDIVSILGMGGRLIADILQAANTNNVKRLVLSPNSEAEYLRDFLEKNHWQIIAETFLEDKGKHYQIICAESGEMTLSDLEKEFGPLIIKEKNPYFVQYIKKLIFKLTQGSKQVQDLDKKALLQQRIKQLEEVIK